MLRNNTFHKRTAKGKVVKVVREHYLRDDIPCGVNECPKCFELIQSSSPSSLLKNLAGSPSQNPKILDKPHYLIPDTNVLLHQLDILNNLEHLILLQTVLKEVEHRSIPIYQKMKQLITSRMGLDTNVKMFTNDHHRETFIERFPDETPNDYNDRTIRKAASWFHNHLEGTGVVLITDDADNRRKAIADGLVAVSTREYVTVLEGRSDLVDMLCNEDDKKDKEQIKYPEHLPEAVLKKGVQNGTFYQGKLNVSAHNYLEGSIYTKYLGKEQAISIIGRMDMNRAIQGDVVVVEVLPREQWRGESGTIVINEEDETALDESDKTIIDDNLQPCGKVVGILKRNWRPYCGFLDRNSISTVHASNSVSQMVTFFPMDQRIPKIKIRTSQAHRLLNQRIVVSIDHWNIDRRFPDGHFVKSLGMAGDKDTETHVLLLEHDVPFNEFSKQILSELPSEGSDWIVRDEHLPDRQDFRDLNICSIDPPGCTDIDDALHARLLPNGNYEVGVHIADVTHFVKPGTHMDTEASHRGTTVYLVNKRIDMLPGLLGTNLCSLHCNVDRLAFSCIWEMDQNANIVDTKFTKSVIRSKASFTYDQAQDRIDDPNAKDDLTHGIRTLNSLAKILRQRRFDNGALTLSSPEVRFSLENESQDPVDVEMKELKDTNALVEEFMLLANISVASHIFTKFPSCSVLRMHPTPPDSNFEKLKKAVHKFNIEIKHGTSKELADSLDAAVIPNDPFFNKLLRIMTTRCMLQAQYICSGKVSEEEFHHYGLATNIYTHFTSPIRRYSDVLVHRLLEASINPNVQLDRNLLDCEKVNSVCDNLNFRHRMAQKASRGSVEVFTHYYFRDRVLLEDGYVIRVMKNGFVVLVPKYGLEGLIHAMPKSDSGAKSKISVLHDEVQDILHFEDAGSKKTSIEMFQKVRVRISVAKQLVGGGEGGLRQNVCVELVEPRVEGLSVDPSGDTTAKGEAALDNDILDGMEKSTKIRKLN